MALLCLKLPSETSRLLTEIDVPGEKTPVSDLHVSILYLGKELDIEAVLLAIQVTHQVVASWAPFLLTTRWVSTFSPNDEGKTPIIARIESQDLHELQEALRDAFDEEGVPYSKKWPEYKPHVTLSYAPEPIEDMIIQPVQWGCTDLCLWAGDEGENDMTCRFPLSIASKAAHAKDLTMRSYVKAVMFAERYSSRPKSRM